MIKKITLIFISGFSVLHFSNAALVVQNVGVSNISATNAVLYGQLVSTNITNAALTVYYGTGNGGTNTAYWQYSNYVGVCTVGQYSVTTTNLSPATYIYWRWKGAEETNIAWASASSNFTTLARLPTNFPATTNAITVMALTNGLLKAPTNFFNANTQFINTAIGGTYATIGALNANSNYFETAKTNLEELIVAETTARTNEDVLIRLDLGTVSGMVVTAQADITNNLANQELTNAYFETEFVKTNHTGNVNIDGELDVYLARRGSTGEYETTEYVAWGSMQDEIAKNSALTIFGNTNAHPVITHANTITREIPAAWCITNTYPDAGTNLVGTYLYTNYVNELRFGTYLGRFFANKVGSGIVNTYMELITTDGTTTNILSTSSPSGLIGTAITQYRLLCALETNQPVAAGFYMGVNFYAVKSGVPTVDFMLCGGESYYTSLETPGLASVDGFGGAGDASGWSGFPATQNVNIAGFIISNGSFIGDGGGLTNLPVTNVIYGTNNNTAYRGDWGVAESNKLNAIKNEIHGGPILTNATSITMGRLAYGTNYGVAIGQNATGNTYGVAVGFLAIGYGNGVAVGQQTIGHDGGVAIGQNANGNLYGVAVGQSAYGTNHGVAVGATAYGPNRAVALGEYSYAVPDSVALGAEVTNLFANSTAIKGTLQIPSGSPTNGAVWIATNTAGQGKWSLPVEFKYTMTANINYYNAVSSNLYFATKNYDLGNNFDGTTLLVPVSGMYNFYLFFYWERIAGAATRATFSVGHSVNVWNNGDRQVLSWTQYLTNNQAYKIAVSGPASTTNYIGGDAIIYGHLIREIP